MPHAIGQAERGGAFTFETRYCIMLKTILALTLVATTLAGCVVYPARPAYVRAPVVVY
jgi:hypothetical protein